MPVLLHVDERWYVRPPDMHRERVSSGGVVVRWEGDTLLAALIREIDSYGHLLDGYVLPKGGLEAGEDIESGARREIGEEAGLFDIHKLDDLAVLERQDANQEWWSINHYGLFITKTSAFAIIDTAHHYDPGWFPVDQLPPMFWPDEHRMIEDHLKRIQMLAAAGR